MLNQHRWLYGLLCLLFITGNLFAQQATDRDPNASQPVASSEILFSYENAVNAISFSGRTNYTIGQALVGRGLNQDGIIGYGSPFTFTSPSSACYGHPGEFS